VNLDQDDELEFGRCIEAMKSIPMARPPIVLGTSAREATRFKSLAYRAGVDDYVARPFMAPDLWLRLDVLTRMRVLQQQLDEATRKLSSFNAQLADSNRKLEAMTLTDELTGLHNMRFMIQFLEKQFDLLRRYERPFSIMMIDLDHFKQVNDRNDHLTGSAAIRSVGAIIEETTRRSDVKARYGGDEYIVALPETDTAQSVRAAERLRVAIEAATLEGSVEGYALKITASIGVATFERGRHKSFTDLIKDADRAMYLAKKNGRNRIVGFTPTEAAPGDYDESQSSVMTAIKKESGSGE